MFLPLFGRIRPKAAAVGRSPAAAAPVAGDLADGACYRPPMNSLDAMAMSKLATLEAKALRRRLVVGERAGAGVVVRNGRPLVSFCCNDYLSLARDPRVIAAANAATSRYGAGAGASRLVTGEHPLLGELEARLAGLKGAEDCVVFGSGYLANLGVIPTLVGATDLILADELSHACMLAGAKMSEARTVLFRHNDLDQLAELLARERSGARRCLILTEGVFSMDGDLAPLPEIAALAAAHDAWLMCDDAHGAGVLGGGRGSSFAFGAPVEVPLQMGTLSKALGSYGGYLCASRPVAELMRSRARTLIYTTGLPPAAAGAALTALDVIAAEPERGARALANAALFCRELGLPEPRSTIVPLVLGDARRALEASAALEAEGFLVAGIRPPTVPRGTARLRFTFSAGHTEADVSRLAAAVRPLLPAREAA
jgi:8-amino-7-oxononanoate synthase